jgi:SAM-dependent methyltransferase
MQRDVNRKLRVARNDRVLEIGCGVGVLGVPIARRTTEYVGVDIANHALDILASRLAEAGLESKTTTRMMDFASAPEADVSALGTFDRVLVYATLHYVRTDAEGERFVRRALAVTRPGGTILFGNLPLEDLGPGIWPLGSGSRHRRQSVRWALAARLDAAGLDVSRWWRVRHLVYARAKHRLAVLRRGAQEPPQSLPPGYLLGLTKGRVEHWLEHAPTPVRYRWCVPAVGVPQYASRADLIVTRVANPPEPLRARRR